eukprot:72859-Chlamydomonas_euryale.AAC.5
MSLATRRASLRLASLSDLCRNFAARGVVQGRPSQPGGHGRCPAPLSPPCDRLASTWHASRAWHATAAAAAAAAAAFATFAIMQLWRRGRGPVGSPVELRATLRGSVDGHVAAERFESRTLRFARPGTRAGARPPPCACPSAGARLQPTRAPSAALNPGCRRPVPLTTCRGNARPARLPAGRCFGPRCPPPPPRRPGVAFLVKNLRQTPEGRGRL